MQVIIPAAGKGLRFYSLGKLYPKLILPVEHLPLVVHNIKIIKSISKVKNITLVVTKENYKELLLLLKFYFPYDFETNFISIVICSGKMYGIGPGSSILEGISTKFKSYLIILSDIILPNNFKDLKFNKSFLTFKYSNDSKRWCVVENKENKFFFYDKQNLSGTKHKALSGIYFIKEGNYLSELLTKINIKHDSNEVEISMLLKLINNKIQFNLKKINIVDYGTLDEYLLNNKIATSRKFNTIKSTANMQVTKSNNSKEFNYKILDEISWYNFMNYNFPKFAAKLIASELDQKNINSYTSYNLEQIKYPTLSQNLLYFDRNLKFWNKILQSIFYYFDECIKYQKLPITYEKQRIYQVTIKRYEKLPLNFRKKISLEDLYEHIKNLSIFDFETYFHGDMVFSNIFFDEKNSLLRLIDPLGKINGNLIYDIAKIFQSIVFKYDFIVSDLYIIKGENIFLFDKEIKPITELFLNKFINKYGVKITFSALKLCGILFLNLIPLHYDRKDHQKIFFELSLKILKVNNNLNTKKVLNQYLKII